MKKVNYIYPIEYKYGILLFSNDDINYKKTKKLYVKKTIIILFLFLLLNPISLYFFSIWFKTLPSKYDFETYDKWQMNQSLVGTTNFMSQDDYVFFASDCKNSFYHYTSKYLKLEKAVLVFEYNNEEYYNKKEYLLQMSIYNSEQYFLYKDYKMNVSKNQIIEYKEQSMTINFAQFYCYDDLNKKIVFIGFWTSKSNSFKCNEFTEIINYYFSDEV